MATAKYVYYVVYMWQSDYSNGWCAVDVTSDRPITSRADVDSTQETIQRNNPQWNTILITNWILLRTEGTGPEKC